MQNKTYSPADIEQNWYAHWEKHGYFRPTMQGDTSFAIQLPPPNVTGTLHMGHAFNQTIMDALTRYHRMRGENTCWIPGSDHAGIATQIVVERQLAAENISRHDLGRDKFLQKIWAWKEESGGTITSQIRRVGCSVDWDKEYFTMDDNLAEVVTEVFVRLYEQGLIYRGKRLVNWDPVLGTAVSDLEVESVEENGKMWHIRYPFVDNPADGLIVATTRPETLLGDVAVAVNPADERYKNLIGKKVILPLTGREIQIIADEYVEKDFGTGCVKITPAHDFNDYQVGKRHNTDLISVLDLTAKIAENAGVFAYDGTVKESFRLPEKYIGKDRYVARKLIVEDLKQQGLLVKIDDHKLMTPKGDRTGSVIEPMLTDQWFVAMTATPKYEKIDSPYKGLSLADKAKKAVSSGAVKFVPENWVNTYNQWMNNIQDWCISRQLWWGHRIPAWYDENGTVFVARNLEEAQKLSGSLNLRQDEDVLDTWFSSALVPFSTLGWTGKTQETPELKAFLPSNVLVTGYEIIFFWVSRMIFMTTHFTGKVPFKDVYIHGIVRDHEGKKMSKSEGNVIDPVDLIEGIDLPQLLEKRTKGLRRPEKAPQVIRATEKLFPNGIPAYGTDALRMTMASYASLGRSVNFDFKRCEGYRNFCNKLWNAARFVLMNCENQTIENKQQYSFADEWILSRLNEVTQTTSEAFDTYRIDLAAQNLYEFVWNEYCDWYLELAKIQIQNGSSQQQQTTRFVLLQVLESVLRLLHPLIPFITEEIWQTVAPLANAKTVDSIMLAKYPEYQEKPLSGSLKEMATLQEVVNAIRNLRGEMGVAPSVKAPLLLESKDDLSAILPYLPSLAKLTEVRLMDALPQDTDAPIAVAANARLMLKVEIDKAAEKARLNKELEKLQKALDKLNAKLSKPGYTEKAPAHLVAKDREELAGLTEKYDKIKQQLAKLA